MDTHRMKLEDKRRKEAINKKIAQSLKKIEENFRQLLKDIEAEESRKQAAQLESFHKELENKIEQEKIVLKFYINLQLKSCDRPLQSLRNKKPQ